jgi:intein/homing endonuclease
MRSYGTITLVKNKWAIRTEPQVALRLKRVFQNINKSDHGYIFLSANPTSCRELIWFLQRYPMDMTDADKAFLEEKSAEHLETEAFAAKVLAGGYVPPEFDLALQPREYQRISADLAMKTGRLLIADEMGLGKTCQAICTFTDPSNLPALVVTLTHLPRQWEKEINRFIPKLRTHVIKKGTPYDVCKDSDGNKTLFPDVLIVNYHKLGGWADTLSGVVKSVVYDECHELRRSESGKYKAAVHISESAKLKCGLSVGPLSNVEFFGGPFGTGWTGDIESAYNLINKHIESKKASGYDIISSENLNIKSRGWTADGFNWKQVNKFIRHICNKPTHQISAGGRSITVTNDHAIYIARDNKLVSIRGDLIGVGEIIPTDNGNRWNSSTPEEKLINAIEIVRKIPRAQVVVSLSSVTKQDLNLNTWQWQNCHKEASYGPRLPLNVFLQFRHLLPEPTKIYIGRGCAPSVLPFIKLSEWAYVLGFFLGDGWVEDRRRVAFSVDPPNVEKLIKALKDMPLGLRPKIQPTRSIAVEIRCSHRIFAEILTEIGIAKKCFEKSIPGDWIISWPESARRKLLQGLIDSDGHEQTKRLRSGIYKESAQDHYTTTSVALAASIHALLRSLGVTAGTHARPPGFGGIKDGKRIIGKRISYQIFWSRNALNKNNEGTKGARRSLDWSKDLFNESRVRKNIETPPPEYVYDLEMDGHPSFVADGLLVHNSGTPIFNFGGEMFNVMNAIEPGCIGERDEFMREWCPASGSDYNRDRPKIRDPQAFGSFLREQGLMIRRTRADVGRELKPLNKIVQHIDADEKSISDIEDSAAELAKIILSQNTLKKGVKMQAAEQLSNILRQVTGIGKAPFVADMARMVVESGEPLLLFGWHREFYSILKSKLADLNPVFYTGSENDKQKHESKEKFMNGESKLLIMSLRSGAGLDGLQNICSTVMFGELDWSFSAMEQGVTRIHRDGQLKCVMAYYLVCEYGSDPAMLDVIGEKKSQLQGIRDPNAELIELSQVTENNTRKLAESFLKQRGLEVKEPSNLSNIIQLKPAKELDEM